MRSSARSSRASRRHADRTIVSAPIAPPPNWPDIETLRAGIDFDNLLRRLVDEATPDAIKLALERMDGKTRRDLLQPFNVPAAKVSVRAATQVLSLIKAEKNLSESSLLTGLFAQGTEMFHVEPLLSMNLVGLRLSQPDLAMRIITHTERLYNGLRVWYRWCDESFESLALAVSIVRGDSHAGLAASYLAATHADVKVSYERLREEFPFLPETAIGGLCVSNPLTRYVAARSDRRMPETASEMEAVIVETARIRREELKRTAQHQARLTREARLLKEPSEKPSVPAASKVRPTRRVVIKRRASRGTANLAGWAVWEAEARSEVAMPDVRVWASVIAESRAITDRLSEGKPADLSQLKRLAVLSFQIQSMSQLLSEVLGHDVEASRAGIDQALTLTLADPQAAKKLGQVPETGADTLDRLEALRKRRAAAPRAVVATESISTAEPDLSDLDSLLEGRFGTHVAAVAGLPRSPRVADTDRDTPVSYEPTSNTTDSTEASADASDDVESDTAQRMAACAYYARIPTGDLTQAYSQLSTEWELAADSVSQADSLVVAASALPMALINPACGAASLLLDDAADLSEFPQWSAFRDIAHEWAKNTTSVYDNDLRAMESAHNRLSLVIEQARHLIESASTRTLKFDKATKVYRHWMSPGGQLHSLLTSICETDKTETVENELAECERTGASKAVDTTASVALGSARTRIIAGARKTLTENFDDVLALAQEYVDASRALASISETSRTTVWIREQLLKLREFVSQHHDAIESEIADRIDLPELVHPLVRLAVDIAMTPAPFVGPEPTHEFARELLFGEDSV